MNLKHSSLIQVREYATLSLNDCEASLDFATISPKTFAWLVELIEADKLRAQIRKNYIKLGSQVGYIEVPSGEQIEILPKIATDEHLSEQVIEPLRSVLQKMVRCAYKLEGREIGSADLKANRLVLHEWIYHNFLMELQRLLKRGLRGDYQQIESTETFLKGRLNVNQMMRQRPGKGHYFPQRYDQFNYARIENRLIKSALEVIASQTESSDNWQRANEFIKRLESVSSICDAPRHFSRWEASKLMLHYEAILPWCRLILERINPNFQKGNHRGIAFLFPMEQLFEQYVGRFLQKRWPMVNVALQSRPYSLLRHQPCGGDELGFFNLQPDITITGKNEVIIGDTKWKILNENKANSTAKYGILQSDIYQMLGYGYRYQHADLPCQNLLLIYPYSSRFTTMLPPFKNYGKAPQQLQIWVIPFAFGIEDSGTIPEGLVIGDHPDDLNNSALGVLFQNR